MREWTVAPEVIVGWCCSVSVALSWQKLFGALISLSEIPVDPINVESLLGCRCWGAVSRAVRFQGFHKCHIKGPLPYARARCNDEILAKRRQMFSQVIDIRTDVEFGVRSKVSLEALEVPGKEMWMTPPSTVHTCYPHKYECLHAQLA